MEENNQSPLEDDIVTLRKKVEQSSNRDFKRKLIGGVDEDEVTSYINNIGER